MVASYVRVDGAGGEAALVSGCCDVVASICTVMNLLLRGVPAPSS